MKSFLEFRSEVGRNVEDEFERLESIAYQVSKERGTITPCCLLCAHRPFSLCVARGTYVLVFVAVENSATKRPMIYPLDRGGHMFSWAFFQHRSRYMLRA